MVKPMRNEDFKILLVEDDPLLQFVFEQQIKKLGLTVHKVVGNGQDAVDTVLSEKYHLVFMDVRMPVLDGLSATERIRLAERSVGVYTPIVGLTAFAQRGKCIRVGMDDFLQKPIVLEELDEVVSKWKNHHSSNPLFKHVHEVKEKPMLEPQDFDPITERLSKVKERINKLRTTFELDRYDDMGRKN